MTMRRKYFYLATLLCCSVALLPGCKSLVDEDLSDCNNEHRIDYRVNLITNMDHEIREVLDKPEDKPVETAVRAWLGDSFTDIAHDVVFSFYDAADGKRASETQETMDKSEFSCTWRLPKGQYTHLCLANLDRNASLQYSNEESASAASLSMLPDNPAETSVVPSLSSIVFTGRTSYESRYSDQPDTPETLDLYTANSATALVLDLSKAGTGIGDIQVRVAGMAAIFHVADNSYTFPTQAEALQIAASKLAITEGTQQCYAALHFPSKDTRTRVVSEPEGYFDAPESDSPVWVWMVNVPIADGTVTQSVLSLKKPLLPGQLKILKAKVHDTGIVTVNDPSVGVSVPLDWNEGIHQEIDL